MGANKIFITNPYGCSFYSYINKICEWVVIIIFIGVLFYYKGDNVTHIQCIPGQDCEGSTANFADPGIAYPVKESTVSFLIMNIVCPIIWIIIFLINMLIIHCYCSLFDTNCRWKIILIKFEILLRSAMVSIVFTSLTTDIIKNSVGRPRPNYLSNDDENDRVKSFPSGHTSYIFSIFFILTIYLFNSLINARKIIYFYRINNLNENNETFEAINDSMQMKQIKNSNNVTAILDDEEKEYNMNDKNKVILLMHRNIFNQLKINKIMNVFNGDSYFFLSIFIYLKHLQLISVFIALSPTIFAIYVGCSRLTDYKHHYSDVLAGALIGIFFSFLSFAYYKAEFYYGFSYHIKEIFTFEHNNGNHGENVIDSMKFSSE